MRKIPPRGLQTRAPDARQPMKEFSSQDLQKRIGVVQEAALVEPIIITFHGRRRHVMMSMDEFSRLQQAAKPTVYRLPEIPDDLLEALAEAKMDPEHVHLDAELSDSPLGQTMEE